jgi:hypothetical protein
MPAAGVPGFALGITTDYGMMQMVGFGLGGEDRHSGMLGLDPEPADPPYPFHLRLEHHRNLRWDFEKMLLCPQGITYWTTEISFEILGQDKLRSAEIHLRLLLKQLNKHQQMITLSHMVVCPQSNKLRWMNEVPFPAKLTAVSL